MARPTSASAFVVGFARSRRAQRAPRRSATGRSPGACARRRARPIRRRRARACRLRRSARRAARARARDRLACSRAAASAWAAARHAASVPPSGAASSLRVGVEQRRAPTARRVRLCQACWPWMSTRCSAASRSWAMVAALPLIQARLFPCASIVRRSEQAAGIAGVGLEAGIGEPAASAGGTSNSALISARAAPSRTTPASPRPPRASCSASTRIDLPAPVSPVSTRQARARTRSRARRR